jgi:hypothetical protein
MGEPLPPLKVKFACADALCGRVARVAIPRQVATLRNESRERRNDNPKRYINTLLIAL